MPDLPPPTPIGFISEMWPPRPQWTADQVPDLSGQVMIVTGGSAGLGKETCRILLTRNAKVYLAARSQAKAQAVIDELKAKTGKTDVYFLKLDLADLPSVRKAAEEFEGKEKELHVLFNNGYGVLNQTGGPVTAQGYDEQFGTNVLGEYGHFFFTILLLPVLLRTAKGEVSGTPRKVRVVNVSSSGHSLLAPPGGIAWETLEKDDASLDVRKKLGMRLYSQSKLGNVLFSNELAKRYGDQGIVSISLHPGIVRTELNRDVNWIAAWIVSKLLLYDVSYGVLTQLYAGTSEEALQLNGEYLTAWARRQVPSKHATDAELMSKLWTWCEQQVEGF
ncbi:NAD-P-binding protein [Amylostereum chailletii]|nr:NAD-P-binding protein [Amylostereum chailletii]